MLTWKGVVDIVQSLNLYRRVEMLREGRKVGEGRRSVRLSRRYVECGTGFAMT